MAIWRGSSTLKKARNENIMLAALRALLCGGMARR